MYSTSARRLLLRPLLRQPASRLPRSRCIATDEATTPSSVLEIDLENLAGPVASTSTSASVFAPLPDEPVTDTVFDDAEFPEEYLGNEVGSSNTQYRGRQKASPNKIKDLELSHSIQVWPELRAINMPGILTIIRNIEARFGHVREFRMIRDKDVPGEYLKGVFLNFTNKESVQKIRDSGTSSMVIPIARWDRVNDGVYGGAGLDEVQAYLRPARPLSAEDSPKEDEARVEADVGAVEDALNGFEDKTEEVADGVAAADPPASLSVMIPCECRIDVIPKVESFVIKPFTFDNYISINPQTRERIARSLIRWGGFYQGYQTASQTESEEERATMSIETSDLRRLVETNEKRAGREVRAMISRAEGRLKDMGLDISVPPPMEKNKKEADANTGSRSQDKPQAVEAGDVSAEMVKALNSPVTVEKPAQTKPKAKALTSDEEQLLKRLAVRTPKKVTAESKPIATTLSTPTPSTSKSPVQKVQKPKARSTPPTITASSAPSSSPSSSSTAPASPSATDAEKATEIENNRARRAAKKAEEEARAGFKAKLLGWIGR